MPSNTFWGELADVNVADLDLLFLRLSQRFQSDQALLRCAFDKIVKPEEDEAPHWEPPIPFGDYALPPFPVEALPAWLRAFVEAESARTQTPSDLAGMLALSVCAVAVAAKYQIGIRAGWYEPLNLFVLIALPPGSRKSAVFKALLTPLEEYERQTNAARSLDIATSKTERDLLAVRYEKKKQEAISGKTEEAKEEAQSAACALASRLENFRLVMPLRLTADDCTPEKLSNLLTEQQGRIGIMSPEGGATFDIISGRYSDSKVANRYSDK